MRVMAWLMAGMVLLAATGGMADEAVIADFGSAEGKLGEVDNKRKDKGGEIAFEKDCLVIEAPNFWSTFFQMQGSNVTLAEMKDATLVAEARGAIADKAPILRLICHNKDWSRTSEWHIDLSGINPDIYSDAKATTPIAEPVAVKGGGLQDEDSLSAIMVFTKAVHGARPWTLRIKTLKAK